MGYRLLFAVFLRLAVAIIRYKKLPITQNILSERLRSGDVFSVETHRAAKHIRAPTTIDVRTDADGLLVRDEIAEIPSKVLSPEAGESYSRDGKKKCAPAGVENRWQICQHIPSFDEPQLSDAIAQPDTAIVEPRKPSQKLNENGTKPVAPMTRDVGHGHRRTPCNRLDIVCSCIATSSGLVARWDSGHSQSDVAGDPGQACGVGAFVA